MKFLRTVSMLVWFVACFSGNLYQIQEISTDFLSYDIVTTINVNFPDQLVAPTMSVCFFESQLANWDKLIKIKPKIKEELNITNLSHEELLHLLKSQGVADKRKFQGFMYRGLDLETRNEIIYKFNDLFKDCQIVKKDGARGQMGNCSELFDIVTYRFVYYICHSFKFKDDQFSLEFLRSNRAETIMGFLYFFRLTELAINITSEAVLSYNTNRAYDRLGFFRYVYLSELSHLISLSYDEYKNILLPKPYVTNCVNYVDEWPGIEIINRGTCYESCIRKKSEQVLGTNKLLPGIFIFDETIETSPELELMTVYELYENDSMIDMKDNMSAECDLLCSSPSCRDTFYVPTLRSSVEYAFACALTYILQSPKIETISNPKLNFAVYLTNIFSTFGFWMGLSFYGILEQMNGAIDKLTEHYKRREKSEKIEKSEKSEKKEQKGCQFEKRDERMRRLQNQRNRMLLSYSTKPSALKARRKSSI